MSETVKNQYMPETVSPPGDTLSEVLENRGMTQAELAGRTGRPTKTINEIIKGKAAITPETALQFEFVLGIPAAFWNNREQHYREALAKKKETESLAAQTDWLNNIPYKSMMKMQWIPTSNDKVQVVQYLLMFFAVASPSSWNDLWSGTWTSFKQSPSLKSDPGAVAAWLRKGEIEAAELQAEEFSPEGFKKVLERIRRLTRELPDDFDAILIMECSRVGVKVVFVPELPRTCTWGATRWLSQSFALIQLSLRYKTDDHLWFTFFHEAGHILLHGKRTMVVETEGRTKDEMELEADAFARECLIPEQEYKKFKRLNARSCAAISRFAFELGIAPGIVVGRLQHDGILARTNCNELKKKIEWPDSEK